MTEGTYINGGLRYMYVFLKVLSKFEDLVQAAEGSRCKEEVTGTSREKEGERRGRKLLQPLRSAHKRVKRALAGARQIEEPEDLPSIKTT